MIVYQKPARRKGMVCHYCRWNREGQVVEAQYRPMAKAVSEAQGELL